MSAAPQPANDVLSDAEVATITGVEPRAWNCVQRRIRILESAGIFFWLGDDGGIVTTWTHVHRAGQEAAQQRPVKTPKFDRVK